MRFWMVEMWCSLLRSPGVFPAIWMPPGAGRAVRYTPVADWTCMQTYVNDKVATKNCNANLTVLHFEACQPTARPRSMFSPTLICICKPNRAFMLRSFSLFISCVCSSYSMNGSRLEMAVAFTSPWAFFFSRHNLRDKTMELTQIMPCYISTFRHFNTERTFNTYGWWLLKYIQQNFTNHFCVT